MKLPTINITGVEVGYNDEDFINSTYSYKKSFTIGEYRYILIWQPINRLIEFGIKKDGYMMHCKISKEMIRQVEISMLSSLIKDMILAFDKAT